MSIEEAFLRDIVDHPDDDTPRLVYADWLDEHGGDEGQARAALIRAQCELERPDGGEVRRKELRREIRRVLKTYRKAWTEPVRKKPAVGGNWQFRRGFLGETRLSARSFPRLAGRLFERAPLLQSVHFPEASNEIAELLGSPDVARLREIDLGRMCVCGFCRIHDELRMLFVSPLVANLTALRLSSDRLNPAVVRDLAQSPHLGGLRRLDLSGNLFGAAGMRELSGSAAFPRLTSLDLSRTYLRKAGVEELLQARFLEGLTSLSLASNVIGSSGAVALASSPKLAGLRVLDLRDNGIGDAAAKALARSEHLAGLTALDLSGNEFASETVRLLRKQFPKRVRL